jgi:hypothetical protein
MCQFRDDHGECVECPSYWDCFDENHPIYNTPHDDIDAPYKVIRYRRTNNPTFRDRHIQRRSLLPA